MGFETHFLPTYGSELIFVRNLPMGFETTYIHYKQLLVSVRNLPMGFETVDLCLQMIGIHCSKPPYGI